MTDAPAIARPSQLWKSLPPDKKLQAAEAFWSEQEAGMEQAEAVALIAQKIKFRAKSVIAMPTDKRARHLASFPNVSELVAARLLVAYHLVHQRPMMGAFLDAVGIAHDNGMIADEELKAPQPETLRKAATTIAGQFPADDVALYLATLLWQDPETWGALAEAPERVATSVRS
jgi:hypothetical protein